MSTVPRPSGGGLRLAAADDGGAVAAIYRPHVTDGYASFETEAPNASEMARRITSTLASHPFLVADVDGVVAAFAYASSHRSRAAYRWAVDVTAYTHDAYRRRGLARALYERLLPLLAVQGFVTAHAGIARPNEASEALHAALGFTRVGSYTDVGFKHGTWRDVVWWRRSLRERPTRPEEPLMISEARATAAWQSLLPEA